MAEVLPEIDTSRPDPVRVYDYLLGGKNHFAADREVADRGLARGPAGRTAACTMCTVVLELMPS